MALQYMYIYKQFASLVCLLRWNEYISTWILMRHIGCGVWLLYRTTDQIHAGIMQQAELFNRFNNAQLINDEFILVLIGTNRYCFANNMIEVAIYGWSSEWWSRMSVPDGSCSHTHTEHTYMCCAIVLYADIELLENIKMVSFKVSTTSFIIGQVSTEY